MIVVRDIFQVKFGKAQDAIRVWKEGVSLIEKATDGKVKPRLLTDMVGGSFYTLVLEETYDSLGAYEQALGKTMAGEEFKRWYQKLTPLVESGGREVLKVVE